MHGKLGLLSPGESEQPEYGTTQRVFFFPYVESFQFSLPPAYSFTTDGYGIFNVHAELGACHTHEA